ncbi:MAG: helix-turn-helix domain-containing protein [Planctomycetota bacterium]
MNTGEKKVEKSDRLGRPDVALMFESVIGCKWSLHVLGQIRQGVVRPGRLRDSADGLTEKVLNERLNKFLRFGVIERAVFAESPPRVEYTLTRFGEKFIDVLDRIDVLRQELSDETPGDGSSEPG